MQNVSDIAPFDLHRIFLGEVPWWFSLEIIFRTAFMYLFALVAVRLVSRRAIGQLSFVEFLLVIALGSAVGDPMFYPEVPLLHSMIVVSVVVLLNRSMTHFINHNEAFETVLKGQPHVLVKSGDIDIGGLEKAHLNREKLFELLRGEEVRQLGELNRAFMEQRGVVSVWRFSEDKHCPGLRVTPPWDLEPPHYFAAGETLYNTQTLGCASCGKPQRFGTGEGLPQFGNCERESWVDAVVEPTN